MATSNQESLSSRRDDRREPGERSGRAAPLPRRRAARRSLSVAGVGSRRAKPGSAAA